MSELIRPACMLLVVLTAITGGLYPLLATLMTRPLFGGQANGSLVVREGVVIGSDLIGQEFTDPRYFWGRPSATTPHPYNAGASGGSNFGPSNPARHQAMAHRVATLKSIDPNHADAIPVDLVTSSASGLDPHISPAAAQYQAARIARIHSIPIREVKRLIEQHATGRQWGVFGEPRVNVLRLNLALDAFKW